MAAKKKTTTPKVTTPDMTTPAETVKRKIVTGKTASDDEPVSPEIRQKLFDTLTSTSVDMKAIEQFLNLSVDKLTQSAVRIQAQIPPTGQSAAKQAIAQALDVVTELEPTRKALLVSMNLATLSSLQRRLGSSDRAAIDLVDERMRKFDGLAEQMGIQIHDNYLFNALEKVKKRTKKVSDPGLPYSLVDALRLLTDKPAIPSKVLYRAFVDFVETLSDPPHGEISFCVRNAQQLLNIPEPQGAAKHMWETTKAVTELATVAWLDERFYPYWKKYRSKYLLPDAEELAAKMERRKQYEGRGMKPGEIDKHIKFISITEAYIEFYKKKKKPKTMGERNDSLEIFAKKAHEFDSGIDNTNHPTKKKIEGFLRKLMNHTGKVAADDETTIKDIRNDMLEVGIKRMPTPTIVDCSKLLTDAGLVADFGKQSK